MANNSQLKRSAHANGAHVYIPYMVPMFMCMLLLPVLAHADSQNFTGNGTFTVPYYTGSLSVTVNGSGGGGSGAYGVNTQSCGKGCTTYIISPAGNNGTNGGGSSFNTSVVGNGGTASSISRAAPGGCNQANGTASGGDTNTTGGGAAGATAVNNGIGGACTTYLASYGLDGTGCPGGAGGQAVKGYAVGALTPGAGISVTVAAAGSGNTGGIGDTCTGNTSNAGTAGNVNVTWTPDTTAPTPNPATFSSAPAGASASSVSMTATTGSDNYTVSYSFAFSACGANGGTGGTSSGWQAGTSYTDSGLEVNKCYGYTIQTRDAVPNTGTASAQNTIYTLANVPSQTTVSSVSYHTAVVTNNENGNPLASPATLFIIYVTSTDANWNNKYIGSGGNPDAGTWLTDAQYTNLTVNSLLSNTTYNFYAYALNGNSIVAGPSTVTSFTTLNDITAPTPNPATFSSAPAPASASSVSMTATSASDAAGSTPVAYSFAFSACGANGGTGGTSSGWQASASYTDSGLQPNQCYGYTIQSRDSIPNTGTASAQSTTYTLANVPSAPTLSGASYYSMVLTNNENSNPAANPTTYFAAYVTSADANWNGKYVAANGSASATAVWLTDAQLTNLTLTGMANNTSYTVGVKARNESTTETALGATSALSTLNDTTAPTPNPSTFSTAPAPDSTTQVSMIASTATDAANSTPVTYIFNFSACGVNGGTGGTSSGWQSSASYSDAGLQPNQCYGYTTQSRDSLSNTTTASGQSTTYTLANAPGTPTVTQPTQTTLQINNNANGNPSSSPSTEYAIQIVAAGDATWNNKYATASGDPSAAAVWLTSAQAANLIITGLTAGVTYQAQVKARNFSNTETAFSSTGSNTTSSEVSTTARYLRLRGVRLRGVRLLLVPEWNIIATSLRRPASVDII